MEPGVYATEIGAGFKNTIASGNYGLLCLADAWLYDKFESASIFEVGAYITHRSDRSMRTYIGPNNNASDDNLMGEGAMFALNGNFSAMRMKKWEHEMPFDNIWFQINAKSSKRIFVDSIL